jgi:hypothetical protein
MDHHAPPFARRLLAAKARLRARRPINETFCFTEAFEECALALKALDGRTLGDSAAEEALTVVRDTINPAGLAVWDARGPGFAKAESLSPAAKAAFEKAIDQLLRFFGSPAGRAFARAEMERIDDLA